MKSTELSFNNTVPNTIPFKQKQTSEQNKQTKKLPTTGYDAIKKRLQCILLKVNLSNWTQPKLRW